MAIVIDHGVAEDAVEPGHYVFLIPHHGSPLQAFHKCGLQNIFRDSPRFDASLQKSQELPVAIHQALDGLGRQRS
jgi:hypothetical protein